MVSVIIPTYNRGYCIVEAIQSVQNQIYKNIEIIVVDDGSTDNTQEIVKAKSKEDVRIKYYYISHSGVSDARNYGIQAAKGDFLSFLDSDDIYLPEKIETHVSFLQQNPDFAVVYSPYIEKHPKHGQQLHRHKYPPDKVFLKLFQGSFITMNSIMFRSSCIKTIGLFREDMFVLEDIDFFLRLADKFRFGFVDTISSVYCMSDRGNRDETANYFAYLSFLKDCYNRYEVIRRNKKLYRWKYSKVLFGLAKSYAKAGNLNESISRTRESLKHHWQPDRWLYLQKRIKEKKLKNKEAKAN